MSAAGFREYHRQRVEKMNAISNSTSRRLRSKHLLIRKHAVQRILLHIREEYMQRFLDE